MGTTAHFFIPISRTLNVPDGYSRTKKPTGRKQNEDGAWTPTADAVHFIFHQVEVEGSPHLTLDACFQRASERAGEGNRPGSKPGAMETAQLTVAEAMVDMDVAQAFDTADAPIGSVDELTVAFDYAISELNTLLRAVALASDAPIKLVAREALPPMIPLATSDTKPWEMIDNVDLPSLQGLIIFNLNMNLPFIAGVPHSFTEMDSMLDAALVNLANDGPFTAYRDFRREADLNYFEEGNYRLAVILYASSCEALLDELLQHNLWESEMRPEHASARFLNGKGRARGIVDLVKNELQGLYQGQGWAREHREVIGKWVADVTSLRNKAVHYGYTPNLEEMKACLDSVNRLVDFIADRVFEFRADRPITALALLGQGGLEARGGWDDKFRDYETSLSDVNLRLRVFQRWRKAFSHFRDGNRGILPATTDQSSFSVVIHPQGKSQYYLVHKNGVLAQTVSREELSLSAEVEAFIDRHKNHALPHPVVVSSEYEVLNLREDPIWGSCTYDILPGYEVCISTLPPFPKD